MGKTIAITGVNSYFASTVLPLLENDEGVDKIIGIDITPWKGGSKKVEFYREDIRSKNLFDILKDVDVVYHLAFIVGEIQDKDKTRDININGSKNVFEACAHNKVKKVIYTSSMTVYGSHSNNHLGFTEEDELSANEDNYYNTSKIQVEKFVAQFFDKHPEMTLTIIRAALLFGPKTNNMFSELFSLPVSALPMGRTSFNQYIHEEDLGDALHLAFQKDLPGIYNVCADDAVSTKWAFKQAGVTIIPLPSRLLKIVAGIGFKLRLFPAGPGWVSVSEHTIYGLSDKFKKAACWQPKYTSRETFKSYLKAQERDAPDNIIQATLSWIFKSGPRTRPTMVVLNIFRLGKIPYIRELVPWMKPEKNSMTYFAGQRED